MAEAEMEKITTIDPETEFLASKRKNGNEWETFKENVRPLKRGRNVNLLNHALNSHTDNQLKKSLVQQRRCIKWVQEAFPPGGDSSGLVVIYEQCVRAFWHSERYKDDLRYLKVWLEYADNCFDADVIYAFLDANGIGKPHSIFYISYALHLESKNKFKAANQMLELGISRNAQPIEKLKAAYRQFFARSMARPIAIDDSVEKLAPTRSFGTVLAKGENHSADTGDTDPHKPDPSHSWHTLGARADRNKENNAIPGKWKSYKVPQRPGTRVGGATPSAFIPVFVDEECQE
ncbi:hypothetical protein JHK85_055650 [Glycine max]|nr:hypothetical protein JHK85_055650 [Glycine max]